MKANIVSKTVVLLSTALFLALAPASLANTTWYVNGVNGNDSNNCMSPTTACKTIGRAISLASPGDTIRVASAIYKENLTIGISLNVIGSGASTTIIDGQQAGRVITISSANAQTTLSNITIRNGNVSGWGGGIYNIGTLTISDSTISGNGGFRGGGIYNEGNTKGGGHLRIHNSTISGNGGGWGGGVFNKGVALMSDSAIGGNSASLGGGIYNTGILTIDKTTLNNNQAIHTCSRIFGCHGGFGSAVYTEATLTINNSTLAANTAKPFGYLGAAIYNIANTLTMNNDTVSGNFGGGVYNEGRATLQNTIVAATPLQGQNCSGPIKSLGYNLSADNTCNFHNIGDRHNTNPMLGPLQYNGGPTQTMALLPGSPAIDAGNPSGCTDGQGHLLKTDQRGMPRPDKEDKTGCDMGAYESQSD